MFNDIILGMGLEAFEDQSDAVVVADQVYTEAVPAVEANLLVAERNAAIEERNFIESGAALAEDIAETKSLMQTEAVLENITASMEAYVAAGNISPEVAKMLHGQLSAALESLGSDVTEIGGGLESFDDSEATLAVFTAGLEALNNAKGTFGSKIANAIMNMNMNLMRRIESAGSTLARIRNEAKKVVEDAKGATGSRHVKVSSKFLATKKKTASTNLTADMAQFSSFVTSLSNGYVDKVASFANSQVTSAMEKMKSVKTLGEAKAVVDKLQIPAYAGANVVVKETPKMSLKRTEVTLGGYAVFELRYKTSPGESVGEITSQVKAITMNRLNMRRAKDEAGSKVVYEADLTPADAIKIANEVAKCADAALAICVNMKWSQGFGDKMRAHVKALNQAVINTDREAEAGVATVTYTICKLPEQFINAMANLADEVPQAVWHVCDAALKVAKQAAKGGEAAPAKDGE